MKYQDILETMQSLIEEQPNEIAILSNASALIKQSFDHINWVGFYLYDGTNLTVGPFQGKVACSLIPLGKGVCGEAALLKKTMTIKDVHQHENHIACDAMSQSECVVPIYLNDRLYGVLDVDSPIINRFDDDIVLFFEHFVKLLIKQLTKATL
ncbi:MAG: GAF domain-containing protein [Acholeplasma sp.]|jgi:GAF domain-containing protein|nr:MAG: GAF domain-containing protein [Acholeplasma sp.]